ncbi:MAG TPA: LamG-like jellyroll fold domain-containing protein [Polyangiaceae bacterium]|nr:LamG-like jellyroll fold domain-containing protein [Polyangiaceae bacterium]
MPLSGPLARAAPLLAGVLLLAGLGGCPQLLDDSFEVPAELPEVTLDGSRDPPRAGLDAGGSVSGVDAGEPPELPNAPGGLGSLLAHRYEFEGSGNTVRDSVGTAHGTSMGAALDGSGALYLPGQDDQYVALPSGLLSGLESVSIECWINWPGSSSSSWGGDEDTWQNLFTFGTSDEGAGQRGNGTRYLYLTPQSANAYGDNLRAGYSLTGFNTESYVGSDRPLPPSDDDAWGTQVVYVIDGVRNELSIFVNGQPEATATSSQEIDLSAIPEVNNWLGRSQFEVSAPFEGELLDVRIYRTALTDAQVELSFDLGADAEL